MTSAGHSVGAACRDKLTPLQGKGRGADGVRLQSLGRGKPLLQAE
jgi:hypothetical protein